MDGQDLVLVPTNQELQLKHCTSRTPFRADSTESLGQKKGNENTPHGVSEAVRRALIGAASRGSLGPATNQRPGKGFRRNPPSLLQKDPAVAPFFCYRVPKWASVGPPPANQRWGPKEKGPAMGKS